MSARIVAVSGRPKAEVTALSANAPAILSPRPIRRLGVQIKGVQRRQNDAAGDRLLTGSHRWTRLEPAHIVAQHALTTSARLIAAPRGIHLGGLGGL